jgi:hypothetical protein
MTIWHFDNRGRTLHFNLAIMELMTVDLLAEIVYWLSLSDMIHFESSSKGIRETMVDLKKKVPLLFQILVLKYISNRESNNDDMDVRITMFDLAKRKKTQILPRILNECSHQRDLKLGDGPTTMFLMLAATLTSVAIAKYIQHLLLISPRYEINMHRFSKMRYNTTVLHDGKKMMIEFLTLLLNVGCDVIQNKM